MTRAAWAWVAICLLVAAFGARSALASLLYAACAVVSLPPAWRWLERQGVVAPVRVRVTLAFVVWLVAALSNPKPPIEDGPPSAPINQAKSNDVDGTVAACQPTDHKTNVDMGVGEDGGQLRARPDVKAKYLMMKVGEEEIPQGIDGSTLIREECRSGTWSRVRIVAPSQFRNITGWVPSSDLVSIKTSSDGRRIYRPADFTWNPGSTANHAAIVTALNMVLRQNPSCEAYDTEALLVSDTSANPDIDAVCVGPKGDQHLEFALADVQSGKIVKAVVREEPSSEITTTLTKADAARQCEEVTLGKVVHPSTADFSLFDTTFEQVQNETRYGVTFTAKNSFGLELKMLSTCVFDGDTLTLNNVVETR